MKLNVVVDEATKIAKMREAAGDRADVQIYQAPSNLNYRMPFPFVMVEDNSQVIREYGSEGEKLFYEIVGK